MIYLCEKQNNMPSRWKGNLEELVSDYNKGMSFDEIKEKHNTSNTKIYSVIDKYKLIRRVSGKDWENIEQQCGKLYEEGVCSGAIAAKYKVDPRGIIKILRKQGYTIKRGTDYLYRTTKDENYFKRIDTEQKAYWLGLLYADGNVYESKGVTQITLQNEDGYLLYKLAECLQYDGKLYSDRGKYTKLIIHSIKMMNDLIKLGCVPRKSLILKFPTEEQVPKELQRHFIRGYFDGDGCIAMRKKPITHKPVATCSFTSTKMFCNALIEVLGRKKIETSVFRKRYKSMEDSAGTVTITKRNSINALYNYMYKGCEELYLIRKKEKFEKCNYDNK